MSNFRIVFLHVSSAQKALNLLEIAQPLERKYCFSLYHPYRRSAENILSILVTFWLLWLRLSDTNGKMKHKVS